MKPVTVTISDFAIFHLFCSFCTSYYIIKPWTNYKAEPSGCWVTAPQIFTPRGATFSKYIFFSVLNISIFQTLAHWSYWLLWIEGLFANINRTSFDVLVFEELKTISGNKKFGSCITNFQPKFLEMQTLAQTFFAETSSRSMVYYKTFKTSLWLYLHLEKFSFKHVKKLLWGIWKSTIMGFANTRWI